MSLENFPRFLLNFSEQEMSGEKRHFYRFKSFRLDVGERLLMRGDAPVALTPKAFDVLAALVARSGHLVEKEDLLRVVWADSFVEEANIARIVHTLRKTLGEDASGNKFIETVAKKGYRFVAEVEEVSEPDEAQSKARQTAAAQSFQTDGDEPAEIAAGLQPPFVAAAPAAAAPVSSFKSKKRLRLFAAGSFSAVFLVLLLTFNFRSDTSVNPNEIKSIAVLPLKSLTDENRNAVYEIGIPDSLIAKLSSAKNLTVRPLSTMQVYAETKKDAIGIGREQKVDYVLASNYQISDGKIRITSQLINVSTGAVEEVFKDEQTISNLFAVQDAFAANFGRKILTKLNRESNNPAAKRYTTNDEAYRLYLLGTALANKRNAKDAAKAIETFEKAIALDLNYALAYTGLAGAHNAFVIYGGGSAENYLKQKAAIEKALLLDENLAEAHARLGELKLNYEWDFHAAEQAMKRGIELNPNSTIAHGMYAVYLTSMGRCDEAISEIKIAIDLEPASVMNQMLLGMILYFARRYDEAIIQLERVAEMDPNFIRTYSWLINSYQMKGDGDKAFEWFLRDPRRKGEPPEKIELWKTLYARSGWRGVVQQQIEDAKQEEREGKMPRWETARLYADLGDNEQAIEYLQKTFEQNLRGHGWTTLKVNPKFDSLRGDPRFQEIVRRVGLK